MGRISAADTCKPFDNLKISPLGLVPKKIPNEFRLIHHLSYSQTDVVSVNEGIHRTYSTVHYSRMEDAISAIKAICPGAFLAKTDIENYFRIVPVAPADTSLQGGFLEWSILLHDQTLPYRGLLPSCKIFSSSRTLPDTTD